MATNEEIVETLAIELEAAERRAEADFARIKELAGQVADAADGLSPESPHAGAEVLKSMAGRLAALLRVYVDGRARADRLRELLG